jgi:hypothetical protein
MTLVLDSGALIALDRNERPMWARLKAAFAAGELPVTHAGVLAEVWTSGARQARLAQALAGIDVQPLDTPLGRAAGEPLAATGLFDVIDAAAVLLSNDGDEIITSDPDDLTHLARSTGRHVELVRP